ncbi:predicted protein [Plenodomus lingam JN3]|uniref:Predicted protein n=1 Tax=Leptosphaeria maculans (strain JN3 / isolate v23.1.3 / race Av1-4-5-6-7-8) TaxID=985895 RepID=E5A0T1_LEPMJ|nr:predicted protein [Plenodomus lingam JN3]CBX97227.1 predicted protein [Plenodomus lingam JN3]
MCVTIGWSGWDLRLVGTNAANQDSMDQLCSNLCAKTIWQSGYDAAKVKCHGPYVMALATLLPARPMVNQMRMRLELAHHKA